jgi:hypothetical protein
VGGPGGVDVGTPVGEGLPYSEGELVGDEVTPATWLAWPQEARSSRAIVATPLLIAGLLCPGSFEGLIPSLPADVRMQG